jgi:hypothetical protein
MADTLDSDPKPRSFALIGPYGSGKSAFGLFLARVLGDPEAEATQAARRLLAAESSELAQRYAVSLDGTRGFCIVALTGSPEALGRSILRALHGAAQRFFAGRWGRAPKVLGGLDAVM